MASLATLLMMIIYTGFKLELLFNNEQYSYRTATKDDFFDDKEKFTSKSNNFMVAVTISNHSDSEMREGRFKVPPSIGKLSFWAFSWSVEDMFFDFSEIPIEPCAPGTFPFNDAEKTDASFFEIDKRS